MSTATEQRTEAEIVISANHSVFDLPEIVALERGLFEDAGLSVRFASGAREENRLVPTERNPIARRKESLFEAEQADVYNLCEWGGIDRLERNRRDGRIGYLRPAVVAQALVSFDPELNEPHDLGGVAVGVQEYTGSHYTALHLLEGTVPREEIAVEHIGSPALRLDRARSGEARAVMLMEPYISLALKQGGKVLGSYFYRGSEVVSPRLGESDRNAFMDVVNAAVDIINADRPAFRGHITADLDGELDESELALSNFRYTHAVPFTQKRFTESYAWMKSWRLTEGERGYEAFFGPR